MNKRIWVPEDLGEVYCDKVYQGFSDDEKEGLVAFDRVQTKLESKCDHEMVTTGSGTYCMKPDCDVNWT